MGFLSKAFKGIKKFVKASAKSVKKVAKGIVTSTPLGKKIWKEAGRFGRKVMKTVGKVTSALGPAGMIALSVLAPYAAPLWASFGAAATTAAAAGSTWGAIGQAVFNAGNWVGGTLGSMSKGITDAIGNISSGAFKEAGNSLVKGFADSFTGKAGSAAVDQGLAEATKLATTNALQQQAATSVVETAAQMQAPGPASQFSGFMDQAPVSTQGLLTKQTAATSAKAAMPTTGGTSLLASAMDVGKKVAGAAADAFSAQPSSAGGYQPIMSSGGGNFGTQGASGQGGVGSTDSGFLTPAMKQQIQQAQARMSRGFGGNY